MDIVTHGVMGVVIAAPLAANHPEAAAAFIMGSVLPDADALSRVGGKRTFLKCHQTYTHSLPIIAVVALVAYGILDVLGFPDYRIAAALALGMVFHSLLDYSNTYGITLLAPFSTKRFCREWVFFIDLPVIVVSLGALALVWRRFQSARFPEAWVSYSYLGFLVPIGSFGSGYEAVPRDWHLRALCLCCRPLLFPGSSSGRGEFVSKFIFSI